MIGRVAVIVPACNEELLIGRCLTALRAAAANLALPVRIIVVLDQCTDETARIVETFADVVAVVTAARNVGAARHLGAAFALHADTAHGLWLASTDADSEVPADWLVRMVQFGETADLVLGTVVPGHGLAPALERAWHAAHRAHDGHPHIHAANLGIHADAYVRLGGWRSLAAHEDVDLTDRALAAGLRVRRAATIPVRTSARAAGRAPDGFSAYVRRMAAAVTDTSWRPVDVAPYGSSG